LGFSAVKENMEQGSKKWKYLSKCKAKECTTHDKCCKYLPIRYLQVYSLVKEILIHKMPLQQFGSAQDREKPLQIIDSKKSQS
jgi:hypothetical protein